MSVPSNVMLKAKLLAAAGLAKTPSAIAPAHTKTGNRIETSNPLSRAFHVKVYFQYGNIMS
jgi:hypothetical protein